MVHMLHIKEIFLIEIYMNGKLCIKNAGMIY